MVLVHAKSLGVIKALPLSRFLLSFSPPFFCRSSTDDLTMLTSVLRSSVFHCTYYSRGLPLQTSLIRGAYWVNEESVWFSTLSFSEPNETQFAFLMNSL